MPDQAPQDPNGFELPTLELSDKLSYEQRIEAYAMCIVHNLGEMYGASVELRQATNDTAIDWVKDLLVQHRIEETERFKEYGL